MIRVVDRGPHKSAVKEVVCRHCGSSLEYTPFDVQEEIVSDYTGSKDIEKVIYCPTCNHRIRV
jgi:uncharacterized protein with PIN domain